MAAHFRPSEVTLRELPDSNFWVVVGGDLTFVDDAGLAWVAPEGTWTDGATVPRLALAATDGRFERSFLKAAVVHDAFCQKENEGRRPPFYSRPWRQVHRMFHDACIAGGTPRRKARVMYSAVRWCGPTWDDPVGEQRRVSPDTALRGLSGSKQWIEEEDPDLDAIEADVERREPQVATVTALQYAALRALKQHDRQKAEARLREADGVLAPAFERAPHDLMFRILQGYQEKNWAMLRPQRKEEHLDQAERLFEGVLAVEPRDASALNGLGSVAILRGDLDQAERYILQAIALEPAYQAARRDLDLVRRLRAAG